jgi:hypothetical protein
LSKNDDIEIKTYISEKEIIKSFYNSKSYENVMSYLLDLEKEEN